MAFSAFSLGARAFWAPAFFLCVLAGCPVSETPVLLSLQGGFDRETIDDTSSDEVGLDYESEGARAEWWPCDARFTASGCVGDHHVNVYLSPPGTLFADLGTLHCGEGEAARGTFEIFAEKREGDYAIGGDLEAYVVVGSNIEGDALIELSNANETTAATWLSGGTLTLNRYGGLDAVGFSIDGTTRAGREVQIEFNGPAQVPAQVPGPQGPEGCTSAK